MVEETKVKGKKRTVMYSVEQVMVKDEVGKGRHIEEQVVVHKFPYDTDDKWGMQKIQRFLNRGYTFEDPRKIKKEVVKAESNGGMLPCPNCGRLCKGEFGLSVHMGTHKKG